MGYNLSTLRNLPKHFDYYFFLIGDYRINSTINDFFRKEFDIIASRLGENLCIVQQTRKSKIDEELAVEISKHHFINITDFLDSLSCQYPGLLILNKHPDNLTKDDMVIHIPFLTLDSIYSKNEELITDLIEFTKGDQQLIEKINKWIEHTNKKIITEFTIGINVGIFSINFKTNKPR